MSATATNRPTELIETAMRLFAERGYANTTVQAIIDEVGIAKGTFYHHFRSKADLLDAVIQEISEAIFAHVQPVLDDPTLDAPTKLATYFRSIGGFKTDRAELMVGLFRALDQDANVRVKARLDEIVETLGTEKLAGVIQQGIVEGTFDCPHPVHTARLVLAVLSASQQTWQQALAPGDGPRPTREELLALVDSQQQAIERLLGAPAGSIRVFDAAFVDPFLDAARERS